MPSLNSSCSNASFTSSPMPLFRFSFQHADGILVSWTFSIYSYSGTSSELIHSPSVFCFDVVNAVSSVFSAALDYRIFWMSIPNFTSSWTYSLCHARHSWFHLNKLSHLISLIIKYIVFLHVDRDLLTGDFFILVPGFIHLFSCPSCLHLFRVDFHPHSSR